MPYIRSSRAFLRRRLVRVSAVALPALSLCLSGCSGAKPREKQPPVAPVATEASDQGPSDQDSIDPILDLREVDMGGIPLPSNPKSSLYDGFDE